MRLAFRLIPLSVATKDRLRQRFLDRHPSFIPPGQRGQSSSSTTRVRRAYTRADERSIGYVPYSKGELPDPLPAVLVAFYLPQFHPIPENDEWWGKGFTEWRNVTRALPQFEGHVQPRLPGDLGFYDLRCPEVMREQARLAEEYGIGAFCFYFYWFGGKTLLETPLLNLLADRTIDFPFCLCWANEKWTRRWDGRNDDVLIEQHHSSEDDIEFISHISMYLRDPRYLRVNGLPMLLVYRPGLLPDPVATAQRWRTWCRENGIGEIHIAYVQGFERPVPSDIGFDAAVEFPPNLSNPSSVAQRQFLINDSYSGRVLDWRELARDCGTRALPSYILYPGVNPSWDNEARQPGKGRVYLHSSPRGYRDWLERTISRRLADKPIAQKLVFINAWNEWAEGATLEPDARLGHAYLEATRNALRTAGGQPAHVKDGAPCVVIHAWHLDAFDEILNSLEGSGMRWRLIVTTTEEQAAEVKERLKDFYMPSQVVVANNRGRDILQFLHVANGLLDEGVDYLLKLHTKRSTHRQDGDQWRRELVNSLVGGSRARTIIAAFEQQPDLGLVGPEGHILPLGFYWGANAQAVRHLAVRMGIPEPSAKSDHFVSGSMFWVRLGALRPLLDMNLDASEFEAESGQVDGTLSHAVERIFGLCVVTNNYRMANAAEVCGEQESPADPPYRYARPG